MIKVGKSVLFLKADEKSSRMGEGDFLRLNDGRIMLAYTKYGEGNGDHDFADIYAVYSNDEGESWSDEKLVLPKDKTAKNYMSVSLRRMNNGDLGLFFLRKDENLNCYLCLARSKDEGESFSDIVRCVKDDGYFVTNNDRVLKLNNGNFIFPGNRHEIVNGNSQWFGYLNTFESKDDGLTWSKISDDISSKSLKDTSGAGLQESGLYQKLDGTIWAFSRTDLGTQYDCFSKDGGKTWSEPRPNKFFTSPTSPMQVKRLSKCTVAVFNPIPNFNNKEEFFPLDRSPYVLAVSTDDGTTFPNTYYLEDDLKNSYCYPAIMECKDGFLIAYYHSNNTGINLNSLKVKKVSFSEIL